MIVHRDRLEVPEDVADALVMASSYNRLPTLLDMHGWIDDALWLQCLGDEWSRCDNISMYSDELSDTPFGWFDGPMPEMMTQKEVDYYNSLPDDFLVYRGCWAANKWGYSWSLSKEKAEQFTVYARYQQPGQPLLVTARAHRSRVRAVKLDRGESEIIIDRPRCVSTRHIRSTMTETITNRVKQKNIDIAARLGLHAA